MYFYALIRKCIFITANPPAKLKSSPDLKFAMQTIMLRSISALRIQVHLLLCQQRNERVKHSFNKGIQRT